MLKYSLSPLNYNKLAEEERVVIRCDEPLFQYNDTSDDDYDEIMRKKQEEDKARNAKKRIIMDMKIKAAKERRATLREHKEIFSNNRRSSSVGNFRPEEPVANKAAETMNTRKSVAFATPLKSRQNSIMEPSHTGFNIRRKDPLAMIEKKFEEEIDPNFIENAKISKKTANILNGKWSEKVNFAEDVSIPTKRLTYKQLTDEAGMTFMSFSSNNFVIQPKFMENRGSMCIAELWANKSKKTVVDQEKQITKNMSTMLDIPRENREYSSLFRPDQLRMQKEITQRAKEQHLKMNVNPTNNNYTILKSMYNSPERVIPSKLKEMYPKLYEAPTAYGKKAMPRSSSLVMRGKPGATSPEKRLRVFKLTERDTGGSSALRTFTANTENSEDIEHTPERKRRAYFTNL